MLDCYIWVYFVKEIVIFIFNLILIIYCVLLYGVFIERLLIFISGFNRNRLFFLLKIVKYVFFRFYE